MTERSEGAGGRSIVRMCEMVAHPETHDDLVRWICEAALADVRGDLGHVHSEVFTSADHRVVVISRWRGEPRSLPDPPRHYVTRPPHSWNFTPVDC